MRLTKVVNLAGTVLLVVGLIVATFGGAFAGLVWALCGWLIRRKDRSWG